MAIFAKRTLNVTEWAPIQDRIGELQMSLGAPHDLMMFSADSDDVGQQDIFIGVPSDGMLAAFPGFEMVDRQSLPNNLTALVVREDGFEERFPDIAAKRGGRPGS